MFSITKKGQNEKKSTVLFVVIIENPKTLKYHAFS